MKKKGKRMGTKELMHFGWEQGGGGVFLKTVKAVTTR